QQLFPSIQELCASRTKLHETQKAWATMGSEELSTLFIKLPPPGHGSSAPVQPRSGPIILNEQQLQNLKVTEINASLATFRACWSPGMAVIPRSYRLEKKPQRLAALRKATAEYSHIQAQRKYHDMDGDTLVAGSRRQRQSAQMLDFDVDEIA
ncbi:hypothetical protein R3P38DRAFT_2516953, partial [Favolaschia claudopus]